MPLFRQFLRFVIFAALTILTQIGGIAYLGSLSVARALKVRHRLAQLAIFLVMYAGATVSANVVAPAFGRVPLSCFAGEGDRLVIRSALYCLLNRNYVTLPMQDMVTALSDAVDEKFPGTRTVVLDGNFPFIDGFPLLPHLSHADGRKLDLAFYYKDANGNFLNGVTRSPIGYFAFEQPETGDEQPCEGRNDIITTRWNFDWLQPVFPVYHIEEQRTGFALQWLSTVGVERFGLEKIFVEPHLKNMLGASGEVIRFQGCRAARHDDHIHIQVR